LINAKLKKQLAYYNGKCWEYHNRMKHTFGQPHKITKLEEQSKKYHVKYYEVAKIIESDGKHKIWIMNGGWLQIRDMEGNIIWNEGQ
jgi:hypothetical protein